MPFHLPFITRTKLFKDIALCLLAQTACYNFIWHTTNCDWDIFSEGLRLRCSQRGWKKNSFILCANMPAAGALYSEADSSFVQGIYHDFPPRSTLTHWCRVWISAETYVSDEKQVYNWSNTQHPHVPKYLKPRVPAGSGPVFVQVRAPSRSCSGRQDLIEGSAKAVTLADSSPRPCWENSGVMKCMTQYYNPHLGKCFFSLEIWQFHSVFHIILHLFKKEQLLVTHVWYTAGLACNIKFYL